MTTPYDESGSGTFPGRQTAPICRDPAPRLLAGAPEGSGSSDQWNGLDSLDFDINDPQKLFVYFIRRLVPPFPENPHPDCVSITGGVRVPTIPVTNVRVIRAAKHGSEDDALEISLGCAATSPPITCSSTRAISRPARRAVRRRNMGTRRVMGMGTGNPSPVASTLFTPRFRSASQRRARREGPGMRRSRTRSPAARAPARARAVVPWPRLLRLASALARPARGGHALLARRHVPDLGIALVELFAYVGDYLSYFQDAVATEAYLATARLRPSVRRHARLIDYAMHEGCNARAWVVVTIKPNPPAAGGSPTEPACPTESAGRRRPSSAESTRCRSGPGG